MKYSDDAVRILIADDHEMIRHGLRHIIEQHDRWRVCGEARSGREAVESAQKLMPHVVIADLVMPELNGVETTRQIKKYLPRTEVLVFSVLESDDLIHQALEAGARGYLVKSDLARHIVDAIEALVHHETYFTAAVSKIMLGAYLDRERKVIDEDKSPTKLTSRERELIQLLGEGYSNKASAARLDMCVKTVETHRASINRKLDLHSTAELVRYAIRNHIIAA
jgi:DNA-binding NarL/FixJ family response regulator